MTGYAPSGIHHSLRTAVHRRQHGSARYCSRLEGRAPDLASPPSAYLYWTVPDGSNDLLMVGVRLSPGWVELGVVMVVGAGRVNGDEVGQGSHVIAGDGHAEDNDAVLTAPLHRAVKDNALAVGRKISVERESTKVRLPRVASVGLIAQASDGSHDLVAEVGHQGSRGGVVDAHAVGVEKATAILGDGGMDVAIVDDQDFALGVDVIDVGLYSSGGRERHIGDSVGVGEPLRTFFIHRQEADALRPSREQVHDIDIEV